MNTTLPVWSYDKEALFKLLNTQDTGLSSLEATKRLQDIGLNSLTTKRSDSAFQLFFFQLKSPIVLLLLVAAMISFWVGEKIDGCIILVIVIFSALVTSRQEYSAGNAIGKLLTLIETKSRVIRDSKEYDIPSSHVVPGDLVVINAGTLIPGDGVILKSKKLFINEASLTGESFPVEKSEGVLSHDIPIPKRINMTFAGTNAVSGSAQIVIVSTGKKTEFGKVAESLSLRKPETDFANGIRHLGYLLIELTMLLTLVVFAVNVFFHRPILDSFLFALALAVGLTPQLLPAIVGANLARGSTEMARANVIVRRPESIENFGSMNVLCSDKTGTVTEGTVKIFGAFTIDGVNSEEVLTLSKKNASFLGSSLNPIDQALQENIPPLWATTIKNIGEIPYDFTRKRVSVALHDGSNNFLITKGALEPLLTICSAVSLPGGDIVPLSDTKEKIQALFSLYSQKGLRVLGVATRDLPENETNITTEIERELTFRGFLVLEDPIRNEIADTVATLRRLGISFKMITGDNRLAASYIGNKIGFADNEIVTGSMIQDLTKEALQRKVSEVDIFAEIEPNQKERIIYALKHAGFVVGYMGDGINDGPALHAADVGISVSNAVDVAKEAADLVLLKPGLEVIVQGVQEGRRVVNNTLKYVFLATSANFGNMFSMAGASLFPPSILSFLPLLPKQILLLNLLTDLPEMMIATDSVDSELVEQPRRLDMKELKRFMLVFGSISSLFDFATFGLLLFLGSSQEIFQTGWFTESLISATLIVLVMRTRRPFYKSLPSLPLGLATGAVILIACVLPYLSIGKLLGLTPLPFDIAKYILLIVVGYALTAEFAKHLFFKKQTQ